jgi:hypothetical protein
MDEKGFLLGQTLKVTIIYCRDQKNSHYTRNGNCKIVTVIEYITTDGRVIPPMYIYKGGKHLLEWHAGMQHREQAIIAWSTTD